MFKKCKKVIAFISFVLCPPISIVYWFVGYEYLFIYGLWNSFITYQNEYNILRLNDNLLNNVIIKWFMHDTSFVTDFTTKIYNNTIVTWIEQMGKTDHVFINLWLSFIGLLTESLSCNGIISILLLKLPITICIFKKKKNKYIIVNNKLPE